jgi:hypothetical protein
LIQHEVQSSANLPCSKISSFASAAMKAHPLLRTSMITQLQILGNLFAGFADQHSFSADPHFFCADPHSFYANPHSGFLG